MSSINGLALRKILNNKNTAQKLLFVNLSASVICFLLSSVGQLPKDAAAKIAFSLAGTTLSASMYGLAKQFDDTEDANEYRMNLIKEDFKEELDSDIAVNQKVREQTEAMKVFRSIEDELAANPTFRLLQQKKKEALDQVDDSEPQQENEPKTVFEQLEEEIGNINDNPLISENQWTEIVDLTKSLGLPQAVTQVTGVKPNDPEWAQIKTEIQRRLNRG